MKKRFALVTACKSDFDCSLADSYNWWSERIKSNIDIFPVENNTQGLCEVYNKYIVNLQDEYEFIIFVHNDVFIESNNFLHTLSTMHLKYDIVGLAGGSKIKCQKPILWHLMTSKDTQSGYVYHPFNKNSDVYPSVFGPVPKQVILLDGLFLSVKTLSIKKHGLMFDENIKGFHHYDIKFCLDAHQKGCKLSTAPIKVIHQSPGLLNRTKEFDESEEYVYKYLCSLMNK